MENETRKTKKVTSRVELEPALYKRIEARRTKLKPVPKLKPFLEMLIEQGLQFKPQPEGER